MESSRPAFQIALFATGNGEVLKCYRQGEDGISFLLGKDDWLQAENKGEGREG